ncbi:transposase [Acetobacter tropicalis]|uniref:transposase n=1 Tax=Acetobacter tropicalis TaxID=104102 RepID=UPI0009EBDD9F
MSNKSKRFPPEFRDSAARMVVEEEKNHPSRCSAVMMIAPKLDIHPDTLSKWPRLHERANAPAVSELPDWEKIRQLERENRALRQAMTRFIKEHRQTYGVGSICKVLPITPSVYYASVARQKIPLCATRKTKSCVMKSAEYGTITSVSTECARSGISSDAKTGLSPAAR